MEEQNQQFKTPKKVRIILPNCDDNNYINKMKGKFRFKTDVTTPFFKPRTNQSFMVLKKSPQNRPKRVYVPANSEFSRSCIIYSEEISREQLKHNEIVKKKRNEFMLHNEKREKELDDIFEKMVQNYDKEAVTKSLLERSDTPKITPRRPKKLFDDATQKLIDNYKRYFNSKFENIQLRMPEKNTNTIYTQGRSNKPSTIVREEKDSDNVDETIDIANEIHDPKIIDAKNADCVKQKSQPPFSPRKFSTPLTLNFTMPILNNIDLADISPIQKSVTNVMKPTVSKVATPYPRNTRTENFRTSVSSTLQMRNASRGTSSESSLTTPLISHSRPLPRAVPMYFSEATNQFDTNNMILNTRKDTYYF